LVTFIIEGDILAQIYLHAASMSAAVRQVKALQEVARSVIIR
jgi:hypothetical protein